MPDARPGGPVLLTVEHHRDTVALRIEDTEFTGGTLIVFPSIDHAVALLEQLADECYQHKIDQVLGHD
jgi:hypothetical protein